MDYGLTFGFDSDFSAYDSGVRGGVQSTTRLDAALDALVASARAVAREVGRASAANAKAEAGQRSGAKATDKHRDALGRFTAAERAATSATDRLDTEVDGLAKSSNTAEAATERLAAAQRRAATAAAQATRANGAQRDALGRFIGANRTAGDATQSLGGRAGMSTLALGALGGMAGGLAVAALGKVRDVALAAAVGIYRMGTDSEETNSKFQTVFGDMAGEVDAFGRNFFNMAGMTTQEGRGMTATFGALAQGMGIAGDVGTKFFQKIKGIDPGLDLVGEASADVSIAVVKLAGDLASFNNTNITDTLNDLRSGLTGEVEPLRKYGIELDSVAVNQLAMATTGKENEKQLTNADKILARLTLAYQRAGVAVGDLDRTSGSLSNRMRYVTAYVKDQATEFASSLVPSIKEAVSVTSEMIDRNKELIRQLSGAVSQALSNTILDLVNLASALFGVIGALADIGTALGLWRDQTQDATDKLGPLTLGLSLISGVADVVSTAIYGIAIALAWVAKYGMIAGAAAAYVVGNEAAYTTLTQAAMGYDGAIQRLIASQHAAGQVRAGVWGQRFGDNAAATAAASAATTRLTADTETATTATTARTRAVREETTALQDANKEAGELTSRLAYMATADGQAALRIAATNDLLQERVDAAEQSARLAASVAFWASAEGQALRAVRLTNAALEARQGFLQTGVMEAVTIRGIPTADELFAAGRVAEAVQQRWIDHLLEEAGKRIARGQGSHAVQLPDGEWATTPDMPALPEPDMSVNAPIEDVLGKPASRWQEAWGGAIDVVNRKFGDLPKVAGNALGRIVAQSVPFASAAGDAFGSIAAVAGAAFEASGEKAGAAFEVQRGFLIAQAVASTYQSAVSSYAAMAPIPFVGPALGIAAAGVAVAGGLFNVAKIAKAKPGESGGGGGTGYGSAPGYGAGARAPGVTGSAFGGGVGPREDGTRGSKMAGRAAGYVGGASDRAAVVAGKATSDMATAAGRMAEAADGLRREGVAVRGRIDYDTVRLQNDRGGARLASEGVTTPPPRGLRRIG